MRKFTVLIFLISLFICNTALAMNIPNKPTSSIYVQDLAGVLSQDTKNKINAMGSQMNEKTKAQVVVLTVKSLDGADIKEYSLEVLRKWGIGDKEKNNGLLILIAVNDKKARFETGYGLEGVFPDGKLGRYRDEILFPSLKKNKFDDGVLATYNEIASEIAKEYNVEVSNADGKPVKSKADEKSLFEVLLLAFLAMLFWQQAIVIIIVLIILYLLFRIGFLDLLFNILGSVVGGALGGGSGGGGGADGDW